MKKNTSVKTFGSDHTRPSKIAFSFFDTDLFKAHLCNPGMLSGQVPRLWQTTATEGKLWQLCCAVLSLTWIPQSPGQSHTHCTGEKSPIGLWWATRTKVPPRFPSSSSLSHHCSQDYAVLNLHPLILHLQEGGTSTLKGQLCLLFFFSRIFSSVLCCTM